MDNIYLFKGKHVNTDSWIYGAYLVHRDTTYCFKEDYDRNKVKEHHLIIRDEMTDWGLPNEIKCYEVKPDTICRCSGLKDNKGVLIYENDVVELSCRDDDKKYRAIVKYGNPNGNYTYGFQLVTSNDFQYNNDILLWVDMEEGGAYINVIGNLFDGEQKK